MHPNLVFKSKLSLSAELELVIFPDENNPDEKQGDKKEEHMRVARKHTGDWKQLSWQKGR